MPKNKDKSVNEEPLKDQENMNEAVEGHGENAENIYLDKPVLNTNTETHVLLPNEARLRNITYVSNLYVDIHILYQVYKTNTNQIIKEDKKVFDKVLLGAIPIMLHSKLCNLYGLNEKNLIDMGECPYDQGGYFIIDGKEKVIIAQERGATNKLFINKSTNIENIYEGYIRCTSEEDSLFPKIVKFFMLSKDIASGKRMNALTVKVPHISTDIPLFVLFRALGVESDKDIIQNIMSCNETDNAIQNILYYSIIDSPGIYTQKDALNFLKEFTDYKTIEHVRYILIFNLLPNVGHDFQNKAIYLGYIINRLISTYLGRFNDTDRDNYMYKRVHLSGFMLSDIFRDFYNGLRRNVRNNIDREYEKGPWRKAGNISEIVNLVNLDLMFPSSFITEGMMKSMKGNWGLMEDPNKQGIVQDLSRISYSSFVSHLRRVNTPIDRSIKIISPHRLNTSQYGYMCPVESPDGASIGLIKNMSMLTHVTFDISTKAIFDALEILGNEYYKYIKDIDIYSINKEYAKLFINNAWVAIISHPEMVFKYFKLLKRNALINIFTSVSWDIMTNVINIIVESGRCCRPLLVIKKGNVLPVTKDTNMIWSDYFCGQLIEKANFDFYNQEFINPFNLINTKDINVLFEKLEESSSIMEFIDVEESNTCMIAMTSSDLNNKNINYTHIEIHPSTMFGIYTSTIPLSNHNQAPRNIFSGAQGKQAVGIYATNFNNRLDTMSYVLHYPQKPIVSTMFNNLFDCDKLPSGENLIVAIACYSGYNQEDSIIINKSSIERGMFNMSYFKTVYDSESSSKDGEIIFTHPVSVTNSGKKCNIKGIANYNKIDINTGLPIINSCIKEDDVYLGKCKVVNKQNKSQNIFNENIQEEEYNDISLKADKTVSGFIDKVFLNHNSSNENNVKIRFRKWRIPELGDKCASRHGQKGVVGMILPNEQMPFTKQGIIPDMIINPHAFPSRMTIAHLLECLISKSCCIDGIEYDGTPFENHDFEKIYEKLKNNGYECHGNEIMYNGMTGDQIETDIFIGPTYYMRLKHMVADKINYRLDGPVTNITRQPTKGRANDGGLRIGTMETDVLSSHGLFGFLKESLMERADGTTFMIDADKGNIIGSAKNVEKVKFINAPYALKPLLFEINTLGINPILITDNT